MLNSIRAQILLFYGILEKTEHATAVVVRRDLGILHDDLLKAESQLAVINIELVHELKKTFTTATPKALVTLVDNIIKHVDELRKTAKLEPSAPFVAGFFDPPKDTKPKIPTPVEAAVATPAVEAPAADSATPEPKLAPVVPFEKPAEVAPVTEDKPKSPPPTAA